MLLHCGENTHSSGMINDWRRYQTQQPLRLLLSFIYSQWNGSNRETRSVAVVYALYFSSNWMTELVLTWQWLYTDYNLVQMWFCTWATRYLQEKLSPIDIIITMVLMYIHIFRFCNSMSNEVTCFNLLQSNVPWSSPGVVSPMNTRSSMNMCT